MTKPVQKYVAHSKIGQMWLKTSHHATFTLIESRSLIDFKSFLHKIAFLTYQDQKVDKASPWTMLP